MNRSAGRLSVLLLALAAACAPTAAVADSGDGQPLILNYGAGNDFLGYTAAAPSPSGVATPSPPPASAAAEIMNSDGVPAELSSSTGPAQFPKAVPEINDTYVITLDYSGPAPKVTCSARGRFAPVPCPVRVTGSVSEVTLI